MKQVMDPLTKELKWVEDNNQQGRTTGTDLNAVINSYDEQYQQLVNRDDMLPGPKSRAINQLKEEYLKRYNETVENKQAELDSDYRQAYRKVNPVPPADVASSPYRQDIIAQLEQGRSAAEMYRHYRLQGHDEGAKVLRYEGLRYARGADNEALANALNRDYPERVEAQKQLKAVEAETLKTGQATALLSEAFSRRMASDEGTE